METTSLIVFFSSFSLLNHCIWWLFSQPLIHPLSIRVILLKPRFESCSGHINLFIHLAWTQQRILFTDDNCMKSECSTVRESCVTGSVATKQWLLRKGAFQQPPIPFSLENCFFFHFSPWTSLSNQMPLCEEVNHELSHSILL